MHTHFHVVVLDGVYVARGDGVAFFASPAPAREALEALVKRVVVRSMKWLKRKRYVREDLDAHASSEPKSLSPLEQLAMLAMQRGTFETIRDAKDGSDDEDDASSATRKQGNVVTHLGFNLHAAVTLAAHDDMGRERLCRYGARPPFSLAKLRLLKDGNVAYLVKKVGRGRAKRRVMDPVEFLARLSALIPPPRFPLLRFAGVLAPRSKWRALIVPLPPSATPAPPRAHRAPGVAPSEKLDLVAPAGPTHPTSVPPTTEPPGPDACAARPAVFAQNLAAQSDAVEVVAPNILSLTHWARLRDGELYAAQPRVDWATLLRRTFDFDVKTCTACGGRLEVRAVVTEPGSAAKILESLARPRAPPRAA